MTDTDPMGTPDPTPSRIPDARRCTATNKSGGRCGQRAIPGGHVCKFHGGAAPQVRKKAQLRLIELIDPAIATLAREMIQADGSSDRQRAANSILDRAGVPRVTKEITEEDSRTVLLTRLREIREQRADGSSTVEQSAEFIDLPASPDGTDTRPTQEAPNED